MRNVLLLLLVSILAGCGGSGTRTGEVSLEMRFAETEPGDGLTRMIVTSAGVSDTFYMHDEVIMDNMDVKSTSVGSWEGNPVVEILFTDIGSEKWGQVTGENVGRRVAIIVNGELMSAPIIRAPILSGRAVINGDFDEAEAKRIAEGISP